MTDFFQTGAISPGTAYKEGDLYKTLQIEDEIFHIYYGYYEECERSNPLMSPMPIYPDFIACPQHTARGAPFVTKMQDACRYYKEAAACSPNEQECADCAFFRQGADLIGICTCPETQQRKGEHQP